MDSNDLPDGISRESINSILARYDAVLPEKLRALDRRRFDAIPEMLRERRAQDDAYLSKEEVVELVDWKLSHGTYRPKLKSLVESNTNIPKITREAFALMPEGTDPDTSTINNALKKLTTLSGIGPATASLLLSTYRPDRIPFFSDELFRWITFAELSNGKGTGWARKIGYTAKEYQTLVEGVAKLQQRVSVSALELEKAAWVLGKEAALSARPAGGNNDLEERADVKSHTMPVAKRATDDELVGRKQAARKESGVIEDQEAGTDGRRRSKRLKSSP